MDTENPPDDGVDGAEDGRARSRPGLHERKEKTLAAGDGDTSGVEGSGEAP